MLGFERFEFFVQFMMPGIQDTNLEEERGAGDDEVCQREAACDNRHDGYHQS